MAKQQAQSLASCPENEANLHTIDDKALLLQQVAPDVLARVRADGGQQQCRHLPTEIGQWCNPI